MHIILWAGRNVKRPSVLLAAGTLSLSFSVRAKARG